MRHLSTGLLLVIAAVSLFAFLANPLNGVPGCDSSIFIYVARRMMAGQVPYLDVFDQKGLLIYVLDAVGWRLGGVAGIWALDVVAFLSSLWLMARMVRFEPVALAVWTVLYHLVACGGNMPEMWIIVFSAVAYSLALNVRADETWKWFAMGVCVAQVLMLKLNMVSVVVPVGVVWMLRGAKPKTAVAGMLGVALGLLPFAVYLAAKGAWGAWWEVYVLYNAEYASRGGWMPSVSRAFWPVAFLWSVNLWMAIWTRRQLAWVNFAYLTAAWGLVLLSGGSVRYYGPVLSACIIPLGFLSETLCGKHPCLWKAVACLVMASSLAVVSSLAFLRNRSAAATRAQYAEMCAVADRIGDFGSVTVLGCDCHVYQVLDAVCPGRFPFQGTVAQCSERYRRQMVEDITRGTSRYLVVPKGVLDVPGFLGMQWAKTAIAERYHSVVRTRRYDLLERNDANNLMEKLK